MGFDPLATTCSPYCGSRRYHMAEKCKGCDGEDRKGCKISDCCNADKKSYFCTECGGFPFPTSKKSIGLHLGRLEDHAKLSLRRYRFPRISPTKKLLNINTTIVDGWLQ
jgi:hypothetical protein